MKMHGAGDERSKRRYFACLKGANRYSEALHLFECYAKFHRFRAFHNQQTLALITGN